LAKQWERIAPVKLGGPAFGTRGERFEPGKYLKTGYVITSRGCPLKCWFCAVWKRDGTVRELPISDGWAIQDDNLLACSEPHIRAVFAMLSRQDHRAEFTGGIEAARLRDWHIELFASLKPRPTLFFAYDPGDAYETIQIAGRKLLAAGFTAASHRLRCYVLIGFPRDTFEGAEIRLRQTIAAGFTPFAMLWRPNRDDHPKRPGTEWRAFQRRWARPAIIYAKPMREVAP
jgi:hypothetical protein